MSQPFDDAAAMLRRSELSAGTWVDGPYGPRPLTYADLTATGRYLAVVERWLSRVRPWYANTHTAISTSGTYMTELREEARAVIRREVNAGPEDVVLFVGSGATAAVNKLVGVLGWRISEPLERQYALSRLIPRHERPVVFVGPYEHHSNELPWLESIAEVVEIDLTPEGAVALDDLERKLEQFSARPLKLGAFSAASNVTGLISDVHGIARVLHRHGAKACFDYAAGGPYLPIDMHPAEPGAHLDAVYLSTHKFIGGPEGSGVLIAHHDLFRTRSPERPGGGTVDYVASFDAMRVDYVGKLEEREEGGTPAIIGDIRAGAAFLVKSHVGARAILEHEQALAAAALRRLAARPAIHILGPTALPRLAIISFNIERLHHDFVSGLLDHLFGIQNRAGCSCAGPYGHRLLGIGPDQSERFRAQVGRGLSGIKPGWVRISLPYHATPEDVDYILSAVEFVADHGHRFLADYRLGWLDGVWRHLHHRGDERAARPSLTLDSLLADPASPPGPDGGPSLADARRTAFEVAHQRARTLGPCTPARPPTGIPELDELVWFDVVHADAPWDSLPAAAPRRPPPSRCSFFHELPTARATWG